MGKKGDLWDDSALMEAFDDAISKYKGMHGLDGSTAAEKAISTNTEEILPAAEADNESNEHVQNDNKLCADVTVKTRDAFNVLQIKEKYSLEVPSDIQNGDPPPTDEEPAVESGSAGKHLISSDIKSQNEPTWYANNPEEYSQLLNKYYEIEGQRQNILQQLNQYSNWNYQNPSTSASEEYPASVPQPYDTVTCYCPYGCQNWVVPCNSLPAYCSGGTCIDKSCNVISKGSENENPLSAEDPDFVQTAMLAAKRALSSLKEEGSGNAEILANGGKDKGPFSESTKCATDLDVVLNAWYSAGFYTGKKPQMTAVELRLLKVITQDSMFLVKCFWQAGPSASPNVDPHGGLRDDLD
ncbi:hypothetical protein BUALT_Bualt10G0010000 [Buddleja alternifolia]|uniref:Survival Motor Neuron Gemin2-binding domain-containing protein n=1 Tax=Buddleja alternifolia TaxID=168488 RepID=A0AAV6WW44_9LAMI|nr:hypothetical protein BUALT_Bualt10G0010000 [Buddleja alternifolia]